MTENEKAFVAASEKKAFDREHRRKLEFNIGQYDKAVIRGKNQYLDLEIAKTRAASIRQKSINQLDKYLIEFESNFIKRGGKVIWAETAKEAVAEVLNIANRHAAKSVVKMKSMVTEEIELNEALEHAGIESLETDLGEYIQQIDGEKPYHILTPAIHKSKEDVAALFNEKFGLALHSTPADITAYVRNKLRNKFVNAHIGISGANFLIADAGAVALTENEGNGLMCVSFPRVHIVVVGLEKIIPSLADLDLFWSLLATHGTGQNITAYNTILFGPKQADETDGPDEMYVILLDNGRTNLLAQAEQRQSLGCIRCGACLNGCPVYIAIGGHSYGTTYSGPIGSVITPHTEGMKENKHLSFASTLCGKCTDVCPVKIDLHKLLLYNRKDAVNKNLSSKTEQVVMYLWKKAMLKRSRMEQGGAKAKNLVLSTFFKKSWGDRREMPKIAPKSFNQLWKEKKGLGQ